MKPRREKKKTPLARPLSGRRLWAFRLTALLLPLVLLGGLELGLRLGGYGFDPHFFKQITIGGEDYFVQNDDFSRLFFPAETARTPGPVRFPAHKALGTFRIFVLGESAAMGDPEPSYGAWRYLEMMLRVKYPDTKFEVVNVAFTAINSHVIVPIARECAQHEGDLWIVYMGNNEMVGPFGAATVFGKRAPQLPYVRLATALERTRTGQLVTDWSRKLGRGGKSAAWGGMEMFLGNEVPPDSPMKETVYRNFAKNLDDIVRAGTDSGAKVLLNTVAVNLRDCPPFASAASSNLPPDTRVQFESAFTQAAQKQSKDDFAGAAALYAQAAKLFPNSADAQFGWGQCLLAQTDFADARGHMQSACDEDALPFRTDSRENEIIRAEAKKFDGGRLVLFDAAAALATNNPDGLCGQETFFEHVHFDFDGNYRLACLWAGQVAAMLPANANAWPSQAVCEQMLGLTDWNRALVLEHMAGRMQVPPFSSQSNNERRMGNLRARADALQAQMNPTNAALARVNFERQMASAPDDFLLRENYALFLQASGDVKGSVEQWRRVHELIPQDYLAYFQVGRLIGAQGQWDEAEAALRQAIALRPSLTEAWVELGNVQASRDNYADALASYETAARQRPQDWQIRYRHGLVLARLNRKAEAVADYREAITLNPNQWEPHFQLGGELDAAGDLAAALQEFGTAAQLNPKSPATHMNYGVLLAKLKRLDEAAQEFETTVRLDPNYPRALEYLDQVRAFRRDLGR